MRNAFPASLTVEAALVVPLFYYFMLAFLYFIQIFTLQEQIQADITEMGMSISKNAYFYKDFPDLTEAVQFDKSIFPEAIGEELNALIDNAVSDIVVKGYASKYMDVPAINQSLIIGGFDGIDFSYSNLRNKSNMIDLIVSYKINLPIPVFRFTEMQMLQRVRLNTWTGHEVQAAYSEQEESEEDIVYITETGKVYHLSDECSHIKLSIHTVNKIPSELRNDSGGKYYPCERCCTGKEPISGTYYITNDGTRYHTKRECSGLKRSVITIPISQVGDRKPCSRCGK